MPLLLRSEEHTSELQSPCNLVCRFFFDRKSTRLNSSHLVISYAVFCLKKKKNTLDHRQAPRQQLARAGPLAPELHHLSVFCVANASRGPTLLAAPISSFIFFFF